MTDLIDNKDGYNGWKNYETWAVAVAIANDPDFYALALKCKTYQDFLDGQWTNFTSKDEDTSVSFSDKRVDRKAIEELMQNLEGAF